MGYYRNPIVSARRVCRGINDARSPAGCRELTSDPPMSGSHLDLSEADARAYEQQIVKLLQEQAAWWAEQPRPSLQPRELESVELRGTRPDTEIVFRFSRLGNFEGLRRNAARSATRAVICRLWQTGYPESVIEYTGTLTSAVEVAAAIWGDWIADKLPPEEV